MTTAISGMMTDVTLATFRQTPSEGGDGYGLIRNACIAWDCGKIIYAGPMTDADSFSAISVVQGQGRLVTPGLIDCHTHVVYAGNRADEFEAIGKGSTYQEIAAAGGGILRTVTATRNAEEATLLRLARQRLHYWLREGVTTMEIKSGYGLSLDAELKLLRVIRQLKESERLGVVATCLAAHQIPSESRKDPAAYLQLVCQQLLPEVKRQDLATFVDVFCESIAFSPEQCRQVLEVATSLGFSVKGHVEQLSQSHGTEMICRYQGASADHVEYVNEDQVRLMAETGTVAVLLPGAFYYLKETQKPPVELFRQYGVPMAVATDHNPGSSPLLSLLTSANLACLLFGLTPEESWQGITRNAAKALGRHQQIGQLKTGYQADLAIWPVEHPAELIYQMGPILPEAVFWRGELRT